MTITSPEQVQALWIGDQERPIFAWFHPARVNAQGQTRQCGVVLCPPFGHEYMVTYHAYRHLAMQLADQGFAVLFFDFHNTGDSSDISESQINLMSQWQGDIQIAADNLRDLAGVTDIVLFGVRMGGLLAASAAVAVRASSMVLCAPIISGRHYARELVMLNNSHHHDPESESAKEEAVTGYPFTSQARKAMGQLDLHKMAVPEVPVLLIARDDSSSQEEHLMQTWGETARLEKLPGYLDFLREDAHHSEVPLVWWQATVNFLNEHFEMHDRPVLVNRLHPRDEIFNHENYVEEIASFNGYQGIICKPVVEIANRPAFVFVNIGANHRVGTHRLYVNLARRLAAAGITSLRFDKAGIGYSKSCQNGLRQQVYSPDGVADVQAALDYMEVASLAQRFVLAGLCSGAYFSWLTAQVDTRLRGLVLLNQLTYNWREGDSVDGQQKITIKSTNFYRRAFLRKETWWRLIKFDIDVYTISTQMSARILKRLRNLWQLSTLSVLRTSYFLGRVAKTMRRIQKSGTEVYLIYAASDAGVDLMTEEFGRHAVLLTRHTTAKLRIFPDCDHTFTPLWAQKALAETLIDYMQDKLCEVAQNAESFDELTQNQNQAHTKAQTAS